MAGVVVSLAVCLLGLLVVYRCLAAWGLRAPGGLAFAVHAEAACRTDDAS